MRSKQSSIRPLEVFEVITGSFDSCPILGIRENCMVFPDVRVNMPTRTGSRESCDHRWMRRHNNAKLALICVCLIPLAGCQHLVIDTDKILKSDINLPEIVGIIAGFGTTFAAFPDFLAMMRRRSSDGMNPRMGAIMGAF